ncbi:MAG: prepilin-type N-terminal cleavage/methylation domain-containing protein [Polyangiaceae bacterium]|nr:prepilin-type N-terminal cleavage/methylation domain-containing protein [Polyangiaceae bacterium]
MVLSCTQQRLGSSGKRHDVSDELACLARRESTDAKRTLGRRGTQGFSLLEVMVATAILGLGLTAILSAQAGAFSAAQHARSISVATGLARCKMLEVEEKLIKDGFPELDETDSGPCCDGDDQGAMRCTWRIEKPEFPQEKLGDLNLDADLNLSGGSDPSSGIGALTSLMSPDGQLASSVPSGGNMSDLAQGIAGTMSGAGGVDGIVGMAMGLVYPDLKAMFESGARRITVTVHWADGSQDRTLEIMQWYTSPAPVVAAAASVAGVATSTSSPPPTPRP